MCHIFGPQRFLPTDFNYSKFLAIKRDKIILRHFPRNYKISVDLRPSSISTRLLSPTTLVLFREISKKKVRRQRRHHLLSQVYGDKSSQHYRKMRLLRLIFKGWFWSGIVSRIRWFSSESGLNTGRHESLVGWAGVGVKVTDRSLTARVLQFQSAENLRLQVC